MILGDSSIHGNLWSGGHNKALPTMPQIMGAVWEEMVHFQERGGGAVLDGLCSEELQLSLPECLSLVPLAQILPLHRLRVTLWRYPPGALPLPGVAKVVSLTSPAKKTQEDEWFVDLCIVIPKLPPWERQQKAWISTDMRRFSNTRLAEWRAPQLIQHLLYKLCRRLQEILKEERRHHTYTVGM